MKRGFALVLALLLAQAAALSGVGKPGTPAPPAAASAIAGTATVIDGDTLGIHGQWVRLYGVDAPESDQTCITAGATYRCGQESALLLAEMIGRGTVACRERDIDRYGRMVAVCYLGGLDLNAWLVENGLALAYRRYAEDYADEELRARERSEGLWRGQFVEPWAWRQGIRLEAPHQTAARGRLLSTDGDRVNLRAGPSTGTRVLAQLYRGDLLEELGRSGDWIQARVLASGKEGWIYGPLARSAPEMPAQAAGPTALAPAGGDLRAATPRDREQTESW